MQDEYNPYAPPRLSQDTQGRKYGHPRSEVFAKCIYRRWLSRSILLSGGLNAEVRYEAWGTGERVFVNNWLAAMTSPMNIHWVVPHIDFDIECSGYFVKAAIDVRVSIFQLFRITRFILTVDDKAVYSG